MRWLVTWGAAIVPLVPVVYEKVLASRSLQLEVWDLVSNPRQWKPSTVTIIHSVHPSELRFKDAAVQLAVRIDPNGKEISHEGNTLTKAAQSDAALDVVQLSSGCNKSSSFFTRVMDNSTTCHF